MRLLHIDSSPSEHSVSRALSAELVQRWCAQDPTLEVCYRDLGVEPPGFLTRDILRAWRTRAEEQTSSQRHELAVGEELIQEFLAADVVVIGSPVFNFSVPVQLRAWIDRVLVAGRTFRYTEDGPVGLAQGKLAVIVMSCGGPWADQVRGGEDFHEAYLRHVLSFVGIRDLEVVRADGLDMGAAARAQAMTRACGQIHRIVAAHGHRCAEALAGPVSAERTG